MFARTPLDSLSLRGPNRVLSPQGKFSSLEIGSSKDTVSIDWLKPVLGPVLGSQQPPWSGPPTSSILVSPPMVQDPGLNPFGEFLPSSAPSLRRRGRPPRARPWSQPPVLGSVPAPGPLLEAVSAPVHRNPGCLAQGVLPTPSSIP